MPNAWGLYDMLGNAWEWCWDRYDGNAVTGTYVDPEGAAAGAWRVTHGGGWTNGFGQHVRAAARIGFFPGERQNYLGLRPVRTVP